MVHRKPKTGIQAATLLAGVVLLLIVFVTAGYFFTLPGDALVEQQDPGLIELADMRRKWERSRPDAHDYVVDRDCDCPRDYKEAYRVVFREGTTRYEYEGDYRRGASPESRLPPDPVDIDALFSIVEDAYREADAVQVFFDADFGFPIYVRIGPGKDSAVGEAGYEIRAFNRAFDR